MAERKKEIGVRPEMVARSKLAFTNQARAWSVIITVLSYNIYYCYIKLVLIRIIVNLYIIDNNDIVCKLQLVMLVILELMMAG